MVPSEKQRKNGISGTEVSGEMDQGSGVPAEDLSVRERKVGALSNSGPREPSTERGPTQLTEGRLEVLKPGQGQSVMMSRPCHWGTPNSRVTSDIRVWNIFTSELLRI